MPPADEHSYTIMRLSRQRWGCRPAKVRALIKAGALEAFTLGNRILISAEAVAAYERSQRVVPARPKRSRAVKDPDYIEYF